MSKQTTEEIKAALDAFERDKAVEVASHDCDTWIKVYNPDWNFYECRFRPCPPKPESRKPRALWVNEFPDGSLRASNYEDESLAIQAGKSLGCPTCKFIEVLPDDPQHLDRTPWVSDGSAVTCDKEHIFHAESRNSARRAVEAHNRAIGIKEEQV